MHENQERPVAADTRNRVIADCAALLPLAQSACAAMDEGDTTEVLRLFCGESQWKTLRRLGRPQRSGDLYGFKAAIGQTITPSFRL